MRAAVLFYGCILLIIKFYITNINGNMEKFSVAFQWNYINFTWESTNALEKAKELGYYVPGQDIIAGIKVYKDIIYLALPRIKNSARVTLASISLKAERVNPLLTPYPSWEMNTGESCETLQNVLSMEIDKDGIMWILDAKRDNNATQCPPRILLLDINRNGEVIDNFIVPNSLCPHDKGCFLNDIVVDGNFAYISDTTKVDPGILIYNRKIKIAYKIRDKSMRGDPAAEHFKAQGIDKVGLEAINGVALSPNCGRNRIFYYMPMSSFSIYSVNTEVLKNSSLKIDQMIFQKHGVKRGQSGGMICDENGFIYYGLLPLDAVASWNTSKSLSESNIVEQNSEIIQWPDSFAIYTNKYLYLITNSILRFSVEGIDVNSINFRIIKLFVDARSYLYCENY